MLGHVLQSVSALFLGFRHRGGYLGHPSPERAPLLLEAMRPLLQVGYVPADGMRLVAEDKNLTAAAKGACHNRVGNEFAFCD